MLIDETGLFLNPLVRRSWSLVGHTPVVGGAGGHRQKVSVIGAVSVSPVAQRLGFYFATAVGGYFSADQVVAFLRDLLRHLRGKVVVVWDGGSNHQGPVIREFLKRNKRLRLERLPPYAPDLNPVEAVWSWLKWGRLANVGPTTCTSWTTGWWSTWSSSSTTRNCCGRCGSDPICRSPTHPRIKNLRDLRVSSSARRRSTFSRETVALGP